MGSILAGDPVHPLLEEPGSAPSRVSAPARGNEPLNTIRKRRNGPGPAPTRRLKTLSGSMFQAAPGCIAANETVWRKHEK
jgi:hypothetical protein